MNNLTPKQRIERAHVSMMTHPATMLYSAILMVGSTTVDDSVPTAATNGRDVVYGESFLAGLTDPQIVGLVLHENLHKVYQHHWLWKSLWVENAKLANMAADFVINLEIVDLQSSFPSFIQLPPGGLYSESYRGMNTKDVFEKLKQSGDSGGSSFDEHDFTQLSEEEQTSVVREIDQAIRQGIMLAGKQNGDVSLSMASLVEPKVNWREQMSEFMSTLAEGRDDSTWRKPNRRWISEDVYMPSAVCEAMGSLVIGIDTSGSVVGELVSAFMSELVGLCNMVKPEIVHVLECDSSVARHTVFSRDELHNIANISELRGGDGTDMRRIFQYVDEHNLKPDAVVVLTDGYTPFPSACTVPSLWAISTKGIASPIGSTVHIS